MVADAAASAMVVGVAAVTVEPDDLGEWPPENPGPFLYLRAVNTVMNS